MSGTYSPVIGDFDGNGATDIVWNANGTGVNSIKNDSLWLGRSLARNFNQTTFAILGDVIPLAGDFDGSGTDDMFLYQR